MRRKATIPINLTSVYLTHRYSFKEQVCGLKCFPVSVPYCFPLLSRDDIYSSCTEFVMTRSEPKENYFIHVSQLDYVYLCQTGWSIVF